MGSLGRDGWKSGPLFDPAVILLLLHAAGAGSLTFAFKPHDGSNRKHGDHEEGGNEQNHGYLLPVWRILRVSGTISCIVNVNGGGKFRSYGIHHCCLSVHPPEGAEDGMVKA